MLSYTTQLVNRSVCHAWTKPLRSLNYRIGACWGQSYSDGISWLKDHSSTDSTWWLEVAQLSEELQYDLYNSMI